MFKTAILSILAVVCLSFPAMAHDFWAGLEKTDSGAKVTVFQGFGHNFPVGEDISAEVVSERFEPLKLLGANGEMKLAQGDKPHAFVSEAALSAGSYFVLAASKEGFASRTPSQFVRKSKAEEPSATSCSFGANYGKNIFTVGEAGDDAWIAKPVGQKMEIVPLVNPEKVKPGDKFPVVVYFDGQPLPRASVGAFFAGFTEGNEALAFSAFTDKDGQVDIIPLKAGVWLAKVSRTEEYSDKTVCDRETYSATLAFVINER